jgi:hypothetical protein
MRLPGFTAQETLRKTEEVYKLAAISGAGESGLIVPQFCFGGQCCTCTDYGCVCIPQHHGHALM